MSREELTPNRRTVIRSISGGAATLGVVGLAGCSGDGGDGSDGGNGGDGGNGDDGSDGSDDPDGDDGSDNGEDDVDFPEREIEVIVPYGPGGGTDTYARLVAKHLPKHLPNEVDTVVQNVEGGGGVLAFNQVYNAEPDGYMIMQGHLENQVTSQLLPEIETEYEVDEYTFLGSPALATRGWHGHTPAVEEYDNWEKLAEGIDTQEIQISASSRGGTGHVGPMMFGELTEDFDPMEIDFVFYQGFADHVPPLIRGDHQFGMCTHSSALQFHRDEENFSIAFVLDDENEDFPSQVEFGVPEDVADQTQNMFTNVRSICGPPDIPEERTEILREAIWDTLQDDELLAEAEEAERPIIPMRGDEVEEAAQDFFENWNERLDLLLEAQES